MSASARSRAAREIGSLYSRIENFDLAICAYCKSPRQCLDHVPPITFAATLDLDKFWESGGSLRLYPSCLECNSLLGSSKLSRYEERLYFLYEAYGKRIKEKQWSEYEIAALGRGLQDFVKGCQYRNQERIEKLRGIEENMLSIGVNAK